MPIFEWFKILTPLFTSKASWWQIVLSFVVMSVSYIIYKKYFEKKRTCVDCLRIIIPEVIKIQVNVREILNKQKNEQKLSIERRIIEIAGKSTGVYYNVNEKLLKNVEVADRVKDYKYYMGISEIAEKRVENELIRAIKENGFTKLSDEIDFQKYVKNKVDNVLEIVHQIIQFFDPEKALEMENEVFNSESKVNRQLYAIVYEIFNQTRRLAIETKRELEKEKDSIDTFIVERMNIKGY